MTNCPYTLNEFFDRFEMEICPKKNPKYADREMHYIKFWRERLGTRIPSSVTDQEIEMHANELYKITSRLGKPYSPETRRKYIQTLTHLFNVASVQWRWISDNPAARVDLHIHAIKDAQGYAKSKVHFSVGAFKKEFMQRVGEKLAEMQIDHRPCVALVKLSKISKASLQQLYDLESNCTLEKVLQLASCVGLDLAIKEKAPI